MIIMKVLMRNSIMKNKERGVTKVALGMIFMAVVFIAGCQNIGTLLSYSQEMSAQHKEMRIQQDRFERVKSAVNNNKLHKNMDCAEIKNRFGEPVVIMDEDNLKRWVYKPGDSKLGNEKVSLYFKDDSLVNWEYLPEQKLN